MQKNSIREISQNDINQIGGGIDFCEIVTLGLGVLCCFGTGVFLYIIHGPNSEDYLSAKTGEEKCQNKMGEMKEERDFARLERDKCLSKLSSINDTINNITK